MKVCHSEAMKLIKELEEKKRLVIHTEVNRSRVSYKEGEEMVPTKYDYAATRKEIAETDGKIRKIKSALAAANCKIKIEDFNITIGEALVLLAQLNAEYCRLDTLGRFDKLSRRITQNGVLEYTECLYEPEKAQADQRAMYAEICKLQVAIDRANLNNYIEV